MAVFGPPARSGPIVLPSSGGVSRVAKGADCKSAASWLRRFESCLPHQPRLALHRVKLTQYGAHLFAHAELAPGQDAGETQTPNARSI